MNALEAKQEAAKAVSDMVDRYDGSEFCVITVQISKRKGEFTFLKTDVELTKHLTSSKNSSQ